MVQRCMKANAGWDLDFTLRVLEGYKQFLKLKQDMEDWSDTKVAPSIPISKMWELHILDTANYERDCQLLVGRMLHNDPDLTKEERNRRIVDTKNVIRLYEDCDAQVWDFGDGNDNDERRTKRPRQTETNSSSRLVSPPSKARSSLPPSVRIRFVPGEEVPNTQTSVVSAESSSPETLTIKIRFVEDGEITLFKIKPTTRMGRIMETYAQWKRMEVENLRFILYGFRIDGDDTARQLGLVDQDEITVLHEQDESEGEE